MHVVRGTDATTGRPYLAKVQAIQLTAVDKVDAAGQGCGEEAHNLTLSSINNKSKEIRHGFV